MNEILIRKFMSTINNQDDKDYLISTIVYSSAPTIAKEKVSSLVIFNNRNERNLYKYWEKYKKEIEMKFPLKFYELKKNDTTVVVLFYNKKKLEGILSQEKNINFLERFGYKKDMNAEESLKLLSSRYENVCPHEIGIFLGYPIDDVVEFINCPNKQCLMLGYWKVYHNPEKAKDIFEKYDMAKDKMVNLLIEGIEPYSVVNNF
ncbi:DUF3793 family protein [Clostridium ganghwense]|uniref:DUF3793 family protein n=1 Tax=Clostridium ganghwense TaxID=312089 RepID=A0ABT4CKP4_9CLOT|nr:DUF3793 family protein [Clostridium ganghwense]MCY6369615.1 DUF3793 family protein [Clostridium ganghwense]